MCYELFNVKVENKRDPIFDLILNETDSSNVVSVTNSSSKNDNDEDNIEDLMFNVINL